MRNSNPAVAVGGPYRVTRLLAASLAAWAFFMVLATALPLLASGVLPLTRNDVVWPSAREVFGPVGYAAAIGLPISLIICFALGYPAWKLASAYGLTTRWDAIKIGAAVGAAPCLLIAVGLHVLVYTSGRQLLVHSGRNPADKRQYANIARHSFRSLPHALLRRHGALAGLAAWLVGGHK